MSKTDLRARPMFHRQRDAIEAHLTIVFTALAIARYLQTATGFRIQKIIRTLKPLLEVQINIGGHLHTAAAPSPTTPATSSTPSGPRTSWVIKPVQVRGLIVTSDSRIPGSISSQGVCLLQPHRACEDLRTVLGREAKMMTARTAAPITTSDTAC